MTIEKLRPTYTFTQERLAALQAVVPEAFADGRINWERLREVLGDYLEAEEADAEHFGLTWPGKRAARRLAATPSPGTLRPAPGEGIDEATTRNLFIEGDNLEVLKLLQKSYAGRVKLIYIDPPYNTGNDFIYKDDFSEPLASYLRRTGQTGEEGELLTTNPKAGGRFHSNWLNMMYPRLLLARNLLSEDGVIFISIDDNEAMNLRALCNEIFGEENFVAQLVWEKGRKNDAKLFSVGHEYILVFVRTKDSNVIWREEKPGAREILAEYRQLKEKFGNDLQRIQEGIRAFYASLPQDHPALKHRRYNRIDANGIWRDDNMSWPGGNGPNYDVIHPITKKPCRVPDGGWRFSSFEKFKLYEVNGFIEYREDHSNPPILKRYLNYVSLDFDPDTRRKNVETDQEEDVNVQVMPSVFYKNAQPTVMQLRKLMGGDVFPNPKDPEILSRLISYVTKKGDTILDFFSGSATTAQAVLEQNREDGGNRRFILVQLPEPTNNPQFPTIAEIGKERIRRVSQRMKQEAAGKLLTERETPEDLGFKVFKLGRSHFKSWSAEAAQAQGEDPGALPTLFDAAESPLVDGWQPDDLLVEILLQEGFPLDSRITVLEFFQQNWVWQVESEACAHRLFLCLDDRLHADTIVGAERISNGLFICLDTALSDEEKLRLADLCRLKVI